MRIPYSVIHLNEFTKDEWRDIAQSAKPELTDEDYERMWAGFMELKNAFDFLYATQESPMDDTDAKVKHVLLAVIDHLKQSGVSLYDAIEAAKHGVTVWFELTDRKKEISQ